MNVREEGRRIQKPGISKGKRSGVEGPYERATRPLEAFHLENEVKSRQKRGAPQYETSCTVDRRLRIHDIAYRGAMAQLPNAKRAPHARRQA